jgi:hypothetical protein
MGCRASVQINSHESDVFERTDALAHEAPAATSGMIKPISSSKFENTSTPSQSFKNQYIPIDAYDAFGRQGNVYRRRSRVSLSKIDIHDLLTESKESIPIESEDLFLTVVAAYYDDLDCSDQLQSLVTSSGELNLKGGPHKYLLLRKPFYHKQFDLTYCYQTDLIQLSRKQDEVSMQGVIIEAPGSHDLVIAKAVVDGIDITDKVNSMVVDGKVLLIPAHSEITELFAEAEDVPSMDVSERSLTISYHFQTPHFTISCFGDEDVYIPNYKSVLASQESVESLPALLEDSSVGGMRRTMSSGHLVTAKPRHDSLGGDGQSFPLSTRSKAESIVMAVPLTMKGYINKESASKVWMNRYFVLDSTDKLAHLAFYKRSSAQFPYGKELRGELSLLDYSLLLDKDYVILRSRAKPDEGVVLEMKDEAYRASWVKAFEEHLYYAELEMLKATRRALQ